MFNVKGQTIRIVARIFLALLWLSTLGVAVAWTMDADLGFEPEPITIILGLLSTAVTAILLEYAHLLEREEYTTSYALAYGYVNNFIEPVVTKLVDMAAPGEEVAFYIPDQLAELYPRSIDRTMARIRGAHYHSDVINLDFAEGRARDVMTVHRDGTGDVKYFDFPNTLLTLASLVDYKVESKKGRFGEAEKAELGRDYIQKFEEEVRKMITQKNIADYVRFTDNTLGFLES